MSGFDALERLDSEKAFTSTRRFEDLPLYHVPFDNLTRANTAPIAVAALSKYGIAISASRISPRPKAHSGVPSKPAAAPPLSAASAVANRASSPMSSVRSPRILMTASCPCASLSALAVKRLRAT